MFAVCNSKTVIPIFQLVHLSAVANFHTLSLCMYVHLELNWECAIANCQYMKGTTLNKTQMVMMVVVVMVMMMIIIIIIIINVC